MDLLDELRIKGIEIKQGYDPNEITLCCPFCVQMGESPDYKFRCGINLESGLGHCFNCGWSSRKAVLDLVRKFSLQESVDQVLNQQFTRVTRRATVIELPDGFQLLDQFDEDDELYGDAVKYALKRGITWDQIKRYEVGATLVGWASYRIVFPVKDIKGKLKTWVARDWTGKAEKKYINMPGGKGVFNCRPDVYPKRLAILSEGITKALAIERATGNRLCSMACLGNSLTDEQAVQMQGFKEIVLFGDPGSQGVRGFLGIASNLTTMTVASLAWPWPEEQADDLSPRMIRELLRGRIKYSFMNELKLRRELL